MSSQVSRVFKASPISSVDRSAPSRGESRAEQLAADIVREICRTMPMLQRMGKQDQEIQTCLRKDVLQQLAAFGTQVE
jgi:hypothetical protein